MGRAPCCAKMGLKKGPWSLEEDQILINYINTHGHANWRALPKHAGLLRCGKSCRLRWTNYLRPDIKRGNFTKEEEDSIINFHEMLGNRWSAIAARLPGRTDNEIKNVWHTHLKKRLPQNQRCNVSKQDKEEMKLDLDATKSNQGAKQDPVNSPQCSSDVSSFTTSDNNENNGSVTTSNNTTNDHDMSIDDINNVDSPENDLALDDDFWSEVLSSDNSDDTSGFPAIGDDCQFQIPFSPTVTEEGVLSASMCDSMDFWYDVYTRAEELTGLLEL